MDGQIVPQVPTQLLGWKGKRQKEKAKRQAWHVRKVSNRGGCLIDQPSTDLGYVFCKFVPTAVTALGASTDSPADVPWEEWSVYRPARALR